MIEFYRLVGGCPSQDGSDFVIGGITEAERLDGDFVLATDYDKLAERIAALEAALREIRDGAEFCDAYTLGLLARTSLETKADQRPCTCHTDVRPPVCQRQFAVMECWSAYRDSLPEKIGAKE